MSGKKVGYIRVSSTDQNTDRQLDGIELDKIFEDKISGKNTDRPQLKEMLGYVREDDHLYVHSLDRLARNLDDLRSMVKDLTNKGVKVTFIKESLTFSGDDSPMSVLLLSVMGAFAEFERSLIKERQREGIELAKKKGVYKGRPKAFDEGQVSMIKERLKAGSPVARIAKDFGVSRETIYKYARTGN